MKKILITGVPGTGKTTLGNFLQKTEGFAHVNLESVAKVDIATLQYPKKDTVITWGFGPNMPEHIKIISQLVGYVYKLFWFDGNREAARREYLKRGTVGEDLLKLQMAKINAVDIKKEFDPIFYDTFDERGKFKPLWRIAKDIIEAK
jgi:hypothetical protein